MSAHRFSLEPLRQSKRYDKENVECIIKLCDGAFDFVGRELARKLTWIGDARTNLSFSGTTQIGREPDAACCADEHKPTVKDSNQARQIAFEGACFNESWKDLIMEHLLWMSNNGVKVAFFPR